MGQFIFTVLFMMVLLAGVFSILTPARQGRSPMKFALDTLGVTPTDTRNRQSFQQVTMTVEGGLMQIRDQMASLAQQQNRFLEILKDRQQVLENFGKDASQAAQAASRAGEKSDQDILRLQALMAQFQDQKRLLVERGQDLIAQNDQLIKIRESIQDQASYAKIKDETTLQMMKGRYQSLQEQTKTLLEQGVQHNQMARQRMEQMRDRLNEMASGPKQEASAQQRVVKERIKQMLEKQNDTMIKLADNEEKSRNLIRDTRENSLALRQRFDDLAQRNRMFIEDSRQRFEDQKSQSKQRAEDQSQMLRDRMNQ